ncbi:hypothetical protein Tco_1325457 [Tanacetum coccineum]
MFDSLPHAQPNMEKSLELVELRYACGVPVWRNKTVNAVPEEIAGIKDEDIFPSIQRLAKVWVEGHSKSHEANWSCWIVRPFDILKIM